MTIGEKIKGFRKNAGLTQKQLAQDCGVAEITIRQYESGKRQPRYEQLQIIAKALNMHLFEFLDDDYFDVATDEEPGSEENELKFLDGKTEVIKEILKNENISQQEKEKILHDHIVQTEIMANLHASHTASGCKFLLNTYFEQLNHAGQEKAIEQVEMLTKIPEYQLDQVVNTVSKAVQDGHIRIVKEKDSDNETKPEDSPLQN